MTKDFYTMQDHQIRSTMHPLDIPKVDTRIWDRLAANVLRSGPAAISRALDQKIYPIPNVSGAQGRVLVSFPTLPLPHTLVDLNMHNFAAPEGLKSACADQRCQLTSYPVGRRFKEETHLNTLVADLFEGIAKGVLATSLPPVRASS